MTWFPQLLLPEVGVPQRSGELHTGDVNLRLCGDDKLVVSPTQGDSVHSERACANRRWMQTALERNDPKHLCFTIRLILTSDEQESTSELFEEDHALKRENVTFRAFEWTLKGFYYNTKLNCVPVNNWIFRIQFKSCSLVPLKAMKAENKCIYLTGNQQLWPSVF